MLFPSLSCQENHGWSCWHCSQVVTACDLPFIHPGRTSSGCAWEACPTDPWPKEDEGHGGYKTDRTQRSMMIHDLWDLEFRRFWIFSLAMLSTCRWPQILCEVLCVSVSVCDMELSLWVLGKESLRDDLGLRTHAGIDVWHVSGTKCLCIASSALKRITELPKSILPCLPCLPCLNPL